jgi:hypothetical protein
VLPSDDIGLGLETVDMAPRARARTTVSQAEANVHEHKAPHPSGW